MIIGHGPLAFALIALILLFTTEFPHRKVLTLALIAGIASILPDIDILFPFFSIFFVDDFTIVKMTTQFWAVAQETHRLATHSFVVLGFVTLVSVSQTYLSRKRQRYTVPATILLVFIAPFSFQIQILMVTVFITIYFLTKYTRETVSATEFSLMFLFGVFLHPLGDMFTGTPPQFFYPFTNPIELTRITFVNPTVHLGFVFLLEVGSLIAAFILISYLTKTTRITYSKIKPQVYHTLVSMIIISILFVFILKTAPTVDSSTQFVFSLVGLTLVSHSPNLVKQNFITYFSDISWTLFFSIALFIFMSVIFF